MSGFVKIDRRVWDDPDPDWEGEPFTQREAWLWMVAHAAWRPLEVKQSHGGRVLVGRGELAHSVRFLAARWLWSKSKTHRFLKQLEAKSRIEKRGTQGGTQTNRITLCKYSEYQDNNCESGTHPGTDKKKQESLRGHKPVLAARARGFDGTDETATDAPPAPVQASKPMRVDPSQYDLAERLTDRCAEALGIDPMRERGWAMLGFEVGLWLTRGHPPGAILDAAKAGRGRARGPGWLRTRLEARAAEQGMAAEERRLAEDLGPIDREISFEEVAEAMEAHDEFVERYGRAPRYGRSRALDACLLEARAADAARGRGGG